MTLAFYPLGAFLAGLFLGSAVTLFAVGLRALDRAATSSGRSMLPGLVAGFHDWADGRRGPRIPISSPGIEPSPGVEAPTVHPEIIELP